MPQYFLGLDAGNTVIKAVIFDTAGRQLAMRGLHGRSQLPSPGHVERDLSEMWTHAGTVIRACIEDAGISAGDIAAIGCAGHGNGLYALDRDDRPLLGIQSLDTRATDLVVEWAGQDRGKALYPLCLQKPWPAQTPTLLAWIRRNRPELYGRIGTVFFAKDMVSFMLTGRRVSDISDMSGAALLNFAKNDYDAELLALYELEDARPMLPPLVWPHEVAGHVSAQAAAATSLCEGTPVVGGLFDVAASALGSGCVAPGQASIIAGSWSINQVVTEEPVVDDTIFMATRFAEGRCLAMENSATSAANLEWYVHQYLEHETEGSPFDLANELVAGVTPAPDDPFYHPFLYGAGLNGDARAGFTGIAAHHDRKHMARALYEGIVFEHRRHVEVLKAAGIAFDEARLSGGGSRSAVWPQLFADIIGVPLRVAVCEETGALGAAIAASLGAGAFADYGSAVAAMTATKAEFTPEKAMRDFYNRRYALYGDIASAMEPIWNCIRASG